MCGPHVPHEPANTIAATCQRCDLFSEGGYDDCLAVISCCCAIFAEPLSNRTRRRVSNSKRSRLTRLSRVARRGDLHQSQRGRACCLPPNPSARKSHSPARPGRANFICSVPSLPTTDKCRGAPALKRCEKLCPRCAWACSETLSASGYAVQQIGLNERVPTTNRRCEVGAVRGRGYAVRYRGTDRTAPTRPAHPSARFVGEGPQYLALHAPWAAVSRVCLFFNEQRRVTKCNRGD